MTSTALFVCCVAFLLVTAFCVIFVKKNSEGGDPEVYKEEVRTYEPLLLFIKCFLFRSSTTTWVVFGDPKTRGQDQCKKNMQRQQRKII